MIRWNLKVTITEFHLILTLILGLHLTLMTLQSKNGSYIVSREESELERKKVAKKKGRIEDESGEVSTNGIYKRKPFVITYIGNLKQKKHSELMALLQGKVSNKGARISGNLTGVELTALGEDVEIESTSSHDFKITEQQKKNLIRRLIKERSMSGVNVCKQTHLLEDEFLMGTVKVSMKIKDRSNLALPRFNGHGNQKVIKSLENCIRSQLVAINFPTELSNQEVSFDIKVN